MAFIDKAGEQLKAEKGDESEGLDDVSTEAGSAQKDIETNRLEMSNFCDSPLLRLGKHSSGLVST